MQQLLDEIQALVDELDYEAQDIARAGMDATGIRSVRDKLKRILRRYPMSTVAAPADHPSS